MANVDYCEPVAEEAACTPCESELVTTEPNFVDGIYVNPSTGEAVTQCDPCCYSPKYPSKVGRVYTTKTIETPGCASIPGFPVSLVEGKSCPCPDVPPAEPACEEEK